MGDRFRVRVSLGDRLRARVSMRDRFRARGSGDTFRLRVRLRFKVGVMLGFRFGIR